MCKLFFIYKKFIQFIIGVKIYKLCTDGFRIGNNFSIHDNSKIDFHWPVSSKHSVDSMVKLFKVSYCEYS
jgi:hypothetical protein